MMYRIYTYMREDPPEILCNKCGSPTTGWLNKNGRICGGNCANCLSAARRRKKERKELYNRPPDATLAWDSDSNDPEDYEREDEE